MVSSRALATAVVVLVAVTPGVAAHSGGLGAPVESRFELPAWVVWFTGAGVVAISFAVVGAFLGSPTLGLERAAPGDAPARRPRALLVAGRAFGLLAFGLLVANAFTPGGPFPETAAWLVAWTALPMLAYAGGNVWLVVSPFRALAPFADALRRGRGPARYPTALGAWPSAIVLLAMIALEVAGGRDGVVLGRLALAYAVATVAGMAVFGSTEWLGHAEAFDRAFRWWSAFAPVRWTAAGARARAPGAALAIERAAGPSDVAVVVALLYGVNFDGFLATRPGAAARAAVASAFGDAAAVVAVLLLGFGVFLGAFWACAAAVRRAAESLDSLPATGAALAPALVPIAVGYHLAHNLFYLVENAPRVLIAWRDPLGLGWNLLPGLAIPATVPLPAWLIGLAAAAQVALVVAGHVAAVVVAHRLAFAAFPSRVQAIRSELPLTGAMVFYTLTGLWILSRHGGAGA